MNFTSKIIGTESPFAVYFADIYIGQILRTDSNTFVADYPEGGTYQLIEEAEADIVKANANELRQTLINKIDAGLNIASKV